MAEDVNNVGGQSEKVPGEVRILKPQKAPWSPVLGLLGVAVLYFLAVGTAARHEDDDIINQHRDSYDKLKAKEIAAQQISPEEQQKVRDEITDSLRYWRYLDDQRVTDNIRRNTRSKGE